MFYCNSFPSAFTYLPPAFQCVLRLSSTKLLSEHFQTLDESELYILYPSRSDEPDIVHHRRRKKHTKIKSMDHTMVQVQVLYIIFPS